MGDQLPPFTTHDSDAKNHPIDVPIVPHDYIRRYLDRELRRRGRTPADVRVLDVGCGRGDTVAWLCAQGWDAHGVDVPHYTERGRDYLQRSGSDPGRLTVFDHDFHYPFDDESFDIVLSNQVIEHAPDLDQFASEVKRVTAPGGTGLHIFPAKWRPVETHLFMPFVHWLPAGRLRRRAISACLRSHIGANYFEDFPLDDRVEIYRRFLEDETFYRPLGHTLAAMERHGLRCDARLASRDKIACHLPKTPHTALPPLGWLYRHFFSVVITTERP